MQREAEALRWLEDWRGSVARPAVSVSGGKDSTLLLMLARRVDPDIEAWRADPPNPLPGRGGHVERLVRAAGGAWRAIPYPWDVGAVLDGRLDYPAGLKVRTLVAAMHAAGVDGVAIGTRIAESSPRRITFATRGPIYRRRDGTVICTPLARWSAEQVVGYLLAADALPLHPVYRCTRGMPDLERLRDGTWWPHGDPGAHRAWLALHYPSVVEAHDRALSIGAQPRSEWGAG